MKYQAIDVEYLKLLQEQKEFEHMKKLMYKGMKYGYYLFIIIILLSAFFRGNLVLAQTSNIEFDFQNGYAYNGVLPESSVLENQRYTTEPNGHFPASYSFENDIDGTVPDDWNKVGIGIVEVLNNLDGHNKIVNVSGDGINTGSMRYYTTSNLIEGTIEFFFYNVGFVGASGLVGFIGSTYAGVLFLGGAGEITYHKFDNSYPLLTTIALNKWIHIKLSVITNTVRGNNLSVWINGFQFLDAGEIYESTVDFSYLRFSSSVVSKYIFDAIGYSWDYYIANEYELSSVNLDFGSLSGNLDDANTDDSNYFTLTSADYAGMESILAYFIFNESYPLSNAYLSYDITSSVNIDFYDDDAIFDDGLSLDDDYVEMIDPISEIFILSLELGAPFTCLVYYIRIFIYQYNYIIGMNLISELGLSNNTETDKFEFTFDDSGNLNVNNDDDVSGFTDIENDFFNNDVVNVYDSIDDDIDKSIRVISAQLGNCGITRDFALDYVNTSEVWWQLDLIEMGFPDSEIYTKIENNDNETIAFFKFNGTFFHSDYPHLSELADLSYYYNSEWVLLESNIGVNANYNMTFVLRWVNGSDYGVLEFDDENYVILFENDQDSLGNVQLYGINDNDIVYNTLDFQIDWIRIIINGSSLSDELMPDNMFILSGNSFSLLTQSFVEITFDISADNNVSIFLNDDIEIIPYIYNVSAERVFFANFYQDKSYSGLFLKIYNSTSYIIENIKVYGIQLVNQQDSNDNPFLEFDYSNVDPNVSYFYVSGNNLYYHLETDDNGNLEYIQATFDISDFICRNYAIAFTHLKGITYLQSETKVVFTTDSYLSFLSINGSKSESLILPQDKTIKEIVFLITDDTNEIIDTSDGYFSAITFIYYPDIDITITTLSLFDVLPIVIIVVIIPLALYVGFDKRKELLVPAILGMSIFGTVIGIIPLWLEAVIVFGCISTYLIKKVKSG